MARMPPTSKRALWQRDFRKPRPATARPLGTQSFAREPRLMSARPLPQPHRVWSYAAVVLLAVVASATGLSNGFALDDLALVADNARVHSLDQWWRLFALPYWPPQYGASLYRPLVTLAYSVQWSAGGGAPWVFHLCSVAFYAALCALVLAFLRQVFAPMLAVIGAALFAVHPVHVEAVANVVGQSELMASLAIVASCIVYLRARRGGALRVAAILSLCGLYGIAVLCKEHALLLPALLAALEWFVVDAPLTAAKWNALGQRVRTTAPLVIGLFVVAVLYVTTRTVVVGELLGEKHLVPIHGVRRLWVMLVVVPHWLRLLVWPAHLSAEYSPRQIEIPTGPGLEIALGVTILLASVVAFIALGKGVDATRPDRSVARLGLAWLAITLLPVSNLFSVMLVAERTLLLPSVGAVLVAGAVVSWATQTSPTWTANLRARVGLATVVAAVVAAGAIRSSERQRAWHDNATLFAQTAEDAPRSYRAQFFYGQLLFEQGRRAEGERRLRLAIALNPTPSDVSPLNYLATQYRDAGLCPQALPLYERALANDEARPDVRYGMAACLLQTGRVREARRLAEDGARRGDLKSLFLQIIARSDSVASSGG